MIVREAFLECIPKEGGREDPETDRGSRAPPEVWQGEYITLCAPLISLLPLPVLCRPCSILLDALSLSLTLQIVSPFNLGTPAWKSAQSGPACDPDLQIHPPSASGHTRRHAITDRQTYQVSGIEARSCRNGPLILAYFTRRPHPSKRSAFQISVALAALRQQSLRPARLDSRPNDTGHLTSLSIVIVNL